MQSHVNSHGFVIVRNVFSPAEIDQLRKIVRGHLKKHGARFSLGKTQPNAATTVTALAPLFSHPRVLELFKRLIGNDSTVFTGHCDIHMNMLSGWHKDSGEAFGGYFHGDYIKADDCRVFKMAIYLQDASNRDGLTVGVGSHRMHQVTAGASLQARTRVGDVVLFDVRLNHTGQLPDPIEKGIKAINIGMKGKSRTVEDHPLATGLKSLYWKLIGRRDRLSIFFTFGASNEYTQEFSKANMVRQNAQAGITETSLPPELISALRGQGVDVFSCNT